MNIQSDGAIPQPRRSSLDALIADLEYSLVHRGAQGDSAINSGRNAVIFAPCCNACEDVVGI